MNLQRLGATQRHILEMMAYKNRVIRTVHDHNEMKIESHMEDEEGENTYFRIEQLHVQRLVDRNIFDIEERSPSLHIDITTLRLKPEAKTLIQNL